MRLTSEYTRVAAPHGNECPYCGEVILDWHQNGFEKNERALYRKELAGDCPLCGGPVYFWSKVKPPESFGAIARQRRFVNGHENKRKIIVQGRWIGPLMIT